MSVHLLNDMSFLDGGFTQEDVELAKENAHKGDLVAQYHLALMFDTGRGVERNPREAAKWYEQSANQGHPNAAYYLARMYSIETSGIDKDEVLARKWYQKAADLGNLAARRKVSN